MREREERLNINQAIMLGDCRRTQRIFSFVNAEKSDSESEIGRGTRIQMRKSAVNGERR